MMDEQSLSVGVLRLNKTGFWHPQSTTYAMFYVAKQFNIELFLFGPDDIDFETETIHGMFLEQNEKVYKDVPFPQIVDNPILGGKYAAMLEQLEKKCILVRHSLNTTKLRTYNRLLKEGTYKHILIPTYLLDHTEKIDGYLDSFGNTVVMKPLRGARGIGIVKVVREGTQYAATYNNQRVSYTHQEFGAFARHFLTQKNYIIQPFMRSRTKQGNPFDIRIHTRRGAHGKFQIHLFPRIGNSAGIVSNISSGGFSMNTEAFLKLEFGSLWKKIYNDLMLLGNNFPEYYQKFYDVTIFDIGMDIGIVVQGDKSYELKMYEVNTYIDGPFFEIEDAVTHFEYYRYLSKQPRPNAQSEA